MEPPDVTELLSRDRYAARLGAELVDHGPGRVAVRMPVVDDHLNFHGSIHGGAVFSLADCAFSLASNAAGDPAVAIDTHLVLTAAAAPGDELTAECVEMTRGRRLATYRATVRRKDGRVVGLFTGTVYITS